MWFDDEFSTEGVNDFASSKYTIQRSLAKEILKYALKYKTRKSIGRVCQEGKRVVQNTWKHVRPCYE